MKKQIKISFMHLAPATLALSLGISSCGSNKEDNTTASGTTVTDEEVTEGTTAETTAAVNAANPLSTAYPNGLAISAFSQSTSTSLALAENKGAPPTADDLDKKDANAKVDDANKRLVGNGDCFSKENVKDRAGFTTPTCYEFDSELAPFKNAQGGSGIEYGSTDGTDGKGEACIVAFARSQMSAVVARLEKGMFMIEAMMCQAKKAAVAEGGTLALPTESSPSLDLKTYLTKATEGAQGMTITTATMDYKGTSDGRPVYYNHVVFTDPSGRTVDVNMTHSPAADGTNSTYNGTLWTIETETTSQASGANPPASGSTVQPTPAGPAVPPKAGLVDPIPVTPGTAPVGQATVPAGQPTTPVGQPSSPSGSASTTTKKRYFQVNYAKTETDGVPNIKADMREARIKDSLTAITSSGELDLNVGASFAGTQGTNGYGDYGSEQSNSIIEGIKTIRFNMNPDTNEGNLDYWVNPGGSYYENARGFVFKLEKNTDGTLAGCAVTGAAHYKGSPEGISIRRAIKEGGEITLEPRGFFHPFAANNATTKTKDTRQLGQMGTSISKQCFKQNSSGVYAIDTSKTASSQGFDVIETAANDIKPPKINEVKAVPPTPTDSGKAKPATQGTTTPATTTPATTTTQATTPPAASPASGTK